jgi:hypothetical protein
MKTPDKLYTTKRKCEIINGEGEIIEKESKVF